ncbi:MAG: helix-turn-helix domain-containing protein [Candidatus Magasanikbacteria bacterium]|nr:helix-turn-helix domain-containing protein [Candidatus Magasanikbacteria bacterium]
MAFGFQQKELERPRRVCLRLKEEREKRKISLEELAIKTKIIKKYLLALEECRFCDLPAAEIYQKNYLRRYVEALGIDPIPFLEQYLVEEKTGENKPRYSFKKSTGQYWQWVPTIARYGFIVILLLAIVFYLGLQVRRIVEVPRLLIYYPPDGLVVDKPAVIIQGETNPEVEVLINGQKIMTNERGMFKEEVNLSSGVNTVVILAKKKHGKTTSETRYVVYKEQKSL